MPQDKRSWTTAAERSWLKASIPEYAEAQKKGRYDKLWSRLFQDYFAAFPPAEPTDDDPTDSENNADPESDAPLESAEEEQLAKTPLGKRKKKQLEQKVRKRAKKDTQKKAFTRQQRAAGYFLYKRKKQIKSFMRWHCPSVSRPRKRGTRTGLFGLPVFGKPARASKSHRMNQEDEVYINLFYPTRIIKTVRERNMEENLKGPGINLIRKVARELYEKEDEETRAIVRAKLASLKKVEESDEEEEELEAGSPTPGQYQEAINTFPPYVEDFLQEVTRLTGFCATLIMGGPIPEHNGNISTVSYHIGKNNIGSTFGVVNRNYNSEIIGTYTEFLRTVYSAEDRAARSLSTSLPVTLSAEGLHAMDVDGDLGTSAEPILNPSTTGRREWSPAAPPTNVIPLPPVSSTATTSPVTSFAEDVIPIPLTSEDVAAGNLIPSNTAPPMSTLAAARPFLQLANPSPRLNRIAQNMPLKTHEAASNKPKTSKPRPSQKKTPKAQAEAELHAIAKLHAAAASAGAGSPTAPSASITQDSGDTQPPITFTGTGVQAVSVAPDGPPIMPFPVAEEGSIIPAGRPRRALQMTEAALQSALEKQAKATAQATAAAKRANRAVNKAPTKKKESQASAKKVKSTTSKRR